jgi:serine/threonine protein kinase
MTTTSAYSGTARYLAFELVESEEEELPTTASDVYALGCIGFEVRYALHYFILINEIDMF